MNRIAADCILIFHFMYVSYILFGILFIIIGFIFHKKAIRNPIFRWTHLGALGIVIAETFLGIFCPLTELEASLRNAAGDSFLYPKGFIAYWVHRILFYDWPAWVFSLLYLMIFLLMIILLILIPPRKFTEVIKGNKEPG